MFQSNHIKLLLGIKDESVTITDVEMVKEDGKEVLVVHGVLSKVVHHCPHCGFSTFDGCRSMVVKNGRKTSRILMCDSSKRKVILNLQKQRFHCRHCQSHFTCSSFIVDRNCFISRQVKLSVLEQLCEKASASYIARLHHVSWSTVQRVIGSLHPHLKRNKEWLPSCLMLDEFRSLKSMEGKMSFICADGDTGKLLDILPSRRLNYIESEFLSYTLDARKMVKFIVTDMNAPYFELAKRCFPNAKVVVDRFHIVQHLNRSFNQVRIRVMKSLNRNDSTQSKQYNQLKSLYKLLLKSSDNLDDKTFAKRRNFDWSYLTEVEVVHRLISISKELTLAYKYYQSLLIAFKNKDFLMFYHLIDSMPSDLPKELKHIKFAFSKYRDAICLSMQYHFSNARIENKNTHIKTLKRVCYGFRNFKNMKVRIFLINDLIRLKLSSKNEKCTKMIA